MLGLKPGATREETREAYLSLAKIYHPDLYMAAELPREVRDYLAAMDGGSMPPTRRSSRRRESRPPGRSRCLPATVARERQCSSRFAHLIT